MDKQTDSSRLNLKGQCVSPAIQCSTYSRVGLGTVDFCLWMALKWWIILEKLSFQHQTTAGCLNFWFQNKYHLLAVMWLPYPLPELEETLIIYAYAEAVWGLTSKLIWGSCVMAIVESVITFVEHRWQIWINISWNVLKSVLQNLLLCCVISCCWHSRNKGLIPEIFNISVLLTLYHPSVVSGILFSNSLS